MGTVWRARDIALHREVALKEVRPPDPATGDASSALAQTLRDRAIREARALARLAHPHVVTIHHIVEPLDGSHPWIVMELVQGGSLHDRLAHGPLPLPEALKIGLDVLSALRAAHAAGVQHRDVKPANVLLRPDGNAVLTDFGIAALRESTSLTATGDLIGSPEYIAPERIRGEEGNPASDLWSLGMLLYVATEGSHPLRRATSLATLVAVLDEPVPPATRSGPLAPVLAGLLVRDTSARPDADRLEELLRAAADEAAGRPARPAQPAGTTPVPSAGQQFGPPVPPPADGAFGPYAPMPPYGSTPYGPTTPVDQVYGLAPVPDRRARRRLPVVLAIAAALVAVSIGAVKLVSVLGGEDSGGGSANHSGGPTASAGGTTGPGRDTDAAGPQASTTPVPTPASKQDDLLTPAGVRAAVASLSAKAGSAKAVDFTVYPGYAIASMPLKTRPSVYDSLQYRDGETSKWGTGGTIRQGSTIIDLSKVDWDKLPALIKRADKELGVPRPTTRYVLVDSDIISGEPSLRVYVGDEYGSGYLAAGLDGTVHKLYPVSG